MSMHIPLEQVGALRTRTHALAAEHDRLYRELERLGQMVDRQAAELRDARGKLHAVQTCQTWVNEDRKRFVFADDIAVALGLISPPGRELPQESLMRTLPDTADPTGQLIDVEPMD
jgi:hypothetical protein